MQGVGIEITSTKGKSVEAMIYSKPWYVKSKEISHSSSIPNSHDLYACLKRHKHFSMSGLQFVDSIEYS